MRMLLLSMIAVKCVISIDRVGLTFYVQRKYPVNYRHTYLSKSLSHPLNCVFVVLPHYFKNLQTPLLIRKTESVFKKPSIVAAKWKMIA